MKKIYHLHIPKTGGTSVNSLLESHYPSDRIMTGEYWNTVRAEVMEVGAWKNFDSFPFDRMFGEHDLICSHMNYTKYVPDDFFTIVFLRDPIVRVISQYQDWRRLRDQDIAHNPEIVANQKKRARDLPLDVFIQDAKLDLTYRYFRNGLCKGFLGERVKAHLLNDSTIYTDDRLYSEAKEILDGMHFVGFLETIDTSMENLCVKLGWQAPQTIPHKNKGSDSSKSQSQYDHVLVESYHQADRRLYDYAWSKYGA